MTATRVRVLGALAASFLLFVLVLSIGQNTISASAALAQPVTDWTYYVRTTNITTIRTAGCNQGTADHNDGNINSEVILDFGGQASGNNGTLLTGSDAFVSYATIESIAENFANAYFGCTTAYDPTSVMKLGIGTNNSAYNISSTGGSTWGSVVLVIYNWVHSQNEQAQVDVVGANDMEPGFDTYSPTSAWVSGYGSSGAPIYLNYGSADGCPQTTHTNGACNNGWNQNDVWYVSWGAPPAYVTPEIYYQTLANQWGQIKLWKYMGFEGPLDEYDLNTGSFTASQAWNALGTAEGWAAMPYSLEIHILS